MPPTQPPEHVVDGLVIAPLPPDTVARRATELMPHFRELAAITCGRYSAEDVVEGARQQIVHVIAIMIGAAICGLLVAELIRDPAGELRCLASGPTGTAARYWPTFLPAVEEWAQARGCVAIAIGSTCPPPGGGFRVTATQYEKALRS